MNDNSIQKMGNKAILQIVPILFSVFINLLDACTFGSIFFPSKLGHNATAVAIELFLISTVVVQIVLIFMSSFDCGLGTSMAENIPFIQSISLNVMISCGDAKEKVFPTILATIILSTLLNGVLFYLVGSLKMGHVLHFFPRHVIYGMTAGVGIFMIRTSFEITTAVSLEDENTLTLMIDALNPMKCIQFVTVVLIEAFLRWVSFLGMEEMLISWFILCIPIVFYLVLSLAGVTFQQARDTNWLFPEMKAVAWYETWSDYQFHHIDWLIVGEQWPTVVGLAFFTLILVPIRIPSLTLISGEEVDFDQELKAQGVANVLSSVVGSVHNYLSYSNSVFYYLLNGHGKKSRLTIAALTTGLFFIGPQILDYIPRILAGVIMAHLGLDLFLGGIVRSRKSLDFLEYCSTLLIAAVVAWAGFVTALGVGVVSACVTFVVQSSRQSNIRSIFAGDNARSNTVWPPKQRLLLDIALAEKHYRILVVQMQGHLFFGNIQRIIHGIEEVLSDSTGILVGPTLTSFSSILSSDGVTGNFASAGNMNNLSMGFIRQRSTSVDSNPVTTKYNFLVLDCSFVTGADVNAIAALLKMKHQVSSTHGDCTIPNIVLFAGLEQRMESMIQTQEELMRRVQEEEIKEEEHFDIDPTFHSSSSSNKSSSPVAKPSSSFGYLMPSTSVRSAVSGRRYSFLDTTQDLSHTLSRRESNASASSHVHHHVYQSVETSSKRDIESPSQATMSPPLPNTYYSDVNTCLQAVEQYIIDAMPSPRPRQVQKVLPSRRVLYGSHNSTTLEAIRELTIDDFDLDNKTGSHSPEKQSSDYLNEANIEQYYCPSPKSNDRAVNSSSTAISDHSGSPPDTLNLAPIALGLLPSSILTSNISPRVVSGNYSETIGKKRSGYWPQPSSPLKLGIEMKRNLLRGPESSSPPQSHSVTPHTESTRSTPLRVNQEMNRNHEVSAQDEYFFEELEHQDIDHNAFSHSNNSLIEGQSPANSMASLTEEERKEMKKLITNMLFDMGSQWIQADRPALKRLVKRLLNNIISVNAGEVLWECKQDAIQMGLLLSGQLQAVIRTNKSVRTVQVIFPGSTIGELGLLSRGRHSRTIIATEHCQIAMLSRDRVDEIEINDKPLFCVLQHLALRTAASRSHELMLFNAGSLGP